MKHIGQGLEESHRRCYEPRSVVVRTRQWCLLSGFDGGRDLAFEDLLARRLAFLQKARYGADEALT